MDNISPTNPDLPILEHIEKDPDADQAAIASQIDVAVGTINWHIKRLVEKGYVKVMRLNRKKLRYIITPEGIAHRARLTVSYIQNQFSLFRLVRERAIAMLALLNEKGYREVNIAGEGDVADVCRLTSMEKGFTLTNDSAAPTLYIDNLKIEAEIEGKRIHE